MLVAAVLVGSVLMQGTPKLRTILPNGAVVYVERIPGARITSVDLFLSARGNEETPATHGYRHLIEHIVARSIPGQDMELETAGGMLNPSTSRDWTRFNWFGPKSATPLFLKYLNLTLKPFSFTDALVKREAGAIRYEAALQSRRDRLSAKSWKSAYGDEGLDPLGDLTLIGKADPHKLTTIWNQMIAAPNVVVSIAGDLDVEEVSRAVSDQVSRLTKIAEKPRGPRKIQGIGAGNDAAYILVEGLKSKVTLASIGLALMCSTSVHGTVVTYTPSMQPGLIVLSNPRNVDLMMAFFLKPNNIELAGGLPRVRALVRSWLTRNKKYPSAVTELRGQLYSLDGDLTPDALIELATSITSNDLVEAMIAARGAGGVNL